MTIFIQITFFL